MIWKFHRSGGRRGVLTAAATACAVTGATLLAVAFTPHSDPPPLPAHAVRAPASQATPQTPPRALGLTQLPPSPPTQVTVPAVGLKVKVDQVGLEESGTIALPKDADDAGWYTGSPTPGQNGNTILVGHVDSHDGPAAFYELGAVKKGDRIEVNRQDGRTAAYVVESMSIWSQNDFPSQRVYGPTPGPQLTLLTCADWNEDRKTYTSNLVITAQPTSATDPGT